MDIETAIWIVAIGLFVGLIVIGGFWVIDRAGMGRLARGVFGGIVLIVIVFTLVYLAEHFNGGSIHATVIR